MIKNYLKIAFRNIWKHKLISMTNLLGLTLGISCCLLLLLFVQYERSFDNFMTDGDRIYRLAGQQSGAISRKLGLSGEYDFNNLDTNYAGVEDAVKIRNNSYTFLPEGDAESKVNVDAFFASSSFFDFFDFPLVAGDPKQVLEDPSSVVLTEETAKALFGDDNPLGKTVTIDASSFKKDLIVTGIAKSMANSHIQFEAIIPWDMTTTDGRQIAHMWFQRSLYTYIKLSSGTNAEAVQTQMNDELVANNPDDDGSYRYFLQPLEEIYLQSDDVQFVGAFESGNMKTVKTLFFIAIIVLTVACINYINLQTARGASRSLEVGIRKVMGANNSQLRGQFLGESVLLLLIASILSVLVIDLSLPYFNQLTGKAFTMEFLLSQGLLPSLFLIALITALFSGVYPAFVLSSFQPSKALKSAKASGLKGGKLRKSLLLIQFGISVFLMVITYITFQQTQFIGDKDLGFNKEQVITFGVTTKNMQTSHESFRKELDNYTGVVSTSLSTDVLGNGFTNNSGMMSAPDNPDLKSVVTIFGVDHEFTKTYDMEIVEGRVFDIRFSSDSSGVLVNQELVKQLALENPIGKKLNFFRSEYTIVGVVKDFNFQALHQKINPVALRIAPRNLWNLSVQLKGESIPETLDFIESTWSKFEPNTAFNYSFIDQRFGQFYESEMRLLKATTFFAIVSIFLTALGLFGMTTFVIERKLKEIGIRKVLGASLSNINFLIFREFGIILLLAFVMAAPLAFYAGSEWLSEFAYRINLTAIPFITALALSMITIGLTVGFQSFKAARTNPAQILKDE